MKFYTKTISIFALIIVFAVSACAPSIRLESGKSVKKPKNIILMIGDGMGLTQVTAGLYMNNGHLNLEQFPVIGLHKNYPKEKTLITDSAAGATAFACGVKSYNAAIGVNADSIPTKTILEIAESNGLATGLVATCAITHATPASFIAHQKQRDMFEPIASDFLKTDVDLIIGGGKKYFDNRTKDTRNLYKELETKGYQVSDFFKEELKDVKTDKRNLAYFTANDHPLQASQGRDYLPFASQFAANFLENRSKKGFFMMIEGSQIDWGGHANNSDYIVTEMIDFDNAIGKILEFAKKNGETLVIVTADHETGGYSINKGSVLGKLETKFTTDYHTGTMIPVYAYGPGAEAFAGIYENSDIFHKMKKLLGL